MSSTPSIARRVSVSARSGTSKQTWWKPSPRDSRNRATPVVSSVGATSSIFDLADRQERDPHPVGRDRHDRLELQAQDVAVEAERRLEVADDHRDVVDPSEPVELVRKSRLR